MRIRNLSKASETPENDPLPLSGPLAGTIHAAFFMILSFIVLNAAATIGTVAYMGSIWGTQIAADLTALSASCLAFFCIGMIAAMVSSGCGYMAQLFYELGGKRSRASFSRGISAGLAICFSCMTLLALALGGIVFAWGIWNAITALSR